MKTLTVTAMIIAASISAASAQNYDGDQRSHSEQMQTLRLSIDSAARDIARQRKQLDGTSDAGAKYRLERRCIAATESGVEGSVRRSYGCNN